ncbi:MAG: PEP-CTERM sorting domain-containing protein [Gammaproteobacteria bacterium]
MLGVVISAQATIIEYDVEQISGKTWEYSYTVINHTSAPIVEFEILFDLGVYENLHKASAPSEWDPVVAQPDPNIPAAGFYDAMALWDEEIAAGETLGGFAVRFDFLGDGTPGSQLFNILDPSNFPVPLDSGTTQLAGTTLPAPVPEPATLLLSLLGIAAMVGAGRSLATPAQA